MEVQDFINNIPWNRFGHAYGNSSDIKERYIKIYNGTANSDDYEYIIYRIEHQTTLFWITTFCLKIIFSLLDKNTSNKKILLEHIITIYEAANYGRKGDMAVNYKPSNKMAEKYTQIKNKIFDERFDGTMDTEFIKNIKSLDRNFMKIMILDFLHNNKLFLESFMKSDDKKMVQTVTVLINSINNPKKYTIDGKEY
jgi:hypothetical protein